MAIAGSIVSILGLVSVVGYWASTGQHRANAHQTTTAQASEPYWHTPAPAPVALDLYLVANGAQVALAQGIPIPEDPSVLNWYRLVDSDTAWQAVQLELSIAAEQYIVRVIDLRDSAEASADAIGSEQL